MNICNGDSTFHNVGYGLFYSGEIRYVNRRVNSRSERKFRLIYDCSSTSKSLVERAIDNFKNGISEHNVDLLVISHFHEDHVSGLRKLLTEFTIENVLFLIFLHLKDC